MQAALAAAEAGRGGTVLVTGEAGIGKSRLVRESTRSAGERGFMVLAGRAVAGGVPTPFRPFAEALASAGRAGRLPGGGDLDPFRPALGRLIPQWRQPQVAGDESLVYLGEAVLRLLRALSPDAGCLLILEDLHWADRETLALLEYLADNLAAERVLCLGTLRDEEGAAAAGLAGVLESRGSAAVLPLGRLDPAAMARMALACVGGTDLPGTVQSLVAERAEGIPFLVEEILAGLIGDGTLAERDGHWHAAELAGTGLPGTFADAVRDRLAGLDADSRQVLCAGAVLGRRFDWTLLGPVTGRPGADMVAALRRGVGLQLVVADRESFRFRHALTHEAVLAGMLPPERALLAGQALAAVEAAHPGLPGTWCMLAAELAESAGHAARAGALLLEAGRRDLALGALASAEHTLTRARALAGPDDQVLRVPVDEALTEVLALSGQVDRAIEMGRTLLARLGQGTGPARAAALHLGIARAAMAGARWAEAAASIGIARRTAGAGAGAAEVDACAAQVAASRGDLAGADKLASAALRAAESSGLPEVACEALEVIGRVARQRDLDAAEQAFARAAAVASAHGLRLWHLRALHELGTIDQLRTESVDRLQQARELAVAQGALALTATLDLQIAAGFNKQFRAGEALAAARRSADASRRFRLATLPMALIFQSTAHAIRGEQQAVEATIAEAISLAPDDPDVLGCSWGHCRATLSLLAEDLAGAHTQMTTGAGLLLSSPATIAPPFLGVWPLLGALLDRDAGEAAARVRAAHGTRHLVVGSLLGYADAILAGRQGRRNEADAAFAAADAQMGPLVAWYRHYARRVSAQAALADGWGDPVAWLREAAEYFAARGDDRVAAACRGLLRRAGAPVPRRRPGSPRLPGQLHALGVTEREADVLRLAARGLGNREIAEAMFLSPRTVEKHVASLLAKTGLRRSQLAGYSSGLD
ncbi:MAG: transcriptional regulator, LuxR family [Actinomycetia bacterium]|nr:transcriptional regulator, LuxR family [Actinomycetes bacterium]